MFNRYFALAGLVLATALSSIPASAAQLNITLSNVESDTGNMQIALYNSETTFGKEPTRALSIPATAGEMTISVDDLPEGDYSIMLYQDVNQNNELDTNLFGLPTEPWGASLGGKAVFGPPSWQATQFSLPASGAQITIAIR